MNWSFFVDWTWATSLVKAVFSKDKAFYWKHIHGSSTFLHNGQPRTGTITGTNTWVNFHSDNYYRLTETAEILNTVEAVASRHRRVSITGASHLREC